MSDTQLYLSIGVPILFNAAMFFMLNKRIDDMKDASRAELRRKEHLHLK